jgi:hypothetical protein
VLLQVDLDHNYVFCLQAFFALRDSELYTLAFFQIAVTFTMGSKSKTCLCFRTSVNQAS